MILLIAAAVSILIALARGGRLANLGHLTVRVGWLVFVALALQLVATRQIVPELDIGSIWSAALLVLSHLVLLAVVIANVRLPGMIVIGLGLALNLVAMLANGGFMPVTREALEAANLSHLITDTEAGLRVAGSKEIVLSRTQARLWVLSDIILVPRPLLTIVSIGDLALALGAFVLFQQALDTRPLRS
jgi:hypothetical protein